MRIGVDTRVLVNEKGPRFRNYTWQLLQHLPQQYSKHQFYSFSDDENNDLMQGLDNITAISITPRAINFLTLKWWYDVKLSLALKKYKIDVLICPNGICSLTTKVPQVLIFQQLNFSAKTSFANAKTLSFYKKYTASFVKKAKVVATVSQNLKDEIVKRYLKKPEEITVTGLGVPAFFKPVEWEEREAIKEQYAEGFEYFIFTGGLRPADNLVGVLKAFSLFKKWQKSGMKLLITAMDDTYLQRELEKLNTYKYRKDVFVKSNLSEPEIPKLVAAAYAAIYTPLSNAFATVVLEALQSEVPVIASTGNNIEEVAGESALFVNPSKPEEIAEAMKTVFKDENLRNKLIETGKQHAATFNPDKSIQVISQLIEAAVCK